MFKMQLTKLGLFPEAKMPYNIINFCKGVNWSYLTVFSKISLFFFFWEILLLFEFGESNISINFLAANFFSSFSIEGNTLKKAFEGSYSTLFKSSFDFNNLL